MRPFPIAEAQHQGTPIVEARHSMLGTFDVTDAPALRRQKSRTELFGLVHKGTPIAKMQHSMLGTFDVTDAPAL